MSLPFYLRKPDPALYDTAPWRTLDLETTNKDKGDPANPLNRIVLACLDGKVRPELEFTELAKPCVLVAHNAKFELGWLKRYDYDLSNFLVWDTMVAEYVLAGNRQMDLSLHATALRYGLPGKDPLVDGLIEGGVCPSEIPEEWLRRRVMYDVRTAKQIALRQKALLEEKGLMPVFFTRCIVTPVLAALEPEGMEVDPERVAREAALQRAALQVNDGKLADMSGGINMRSRPQLGAYLYDKLGFQELRDRNGEPLRTRTGLRATDGDSLAALKAETPEQRLFLKLLEARTHADTRLSKSLLCFEGAVLTQENRLFGAFNQCVTATHRLSSSAKKILCVDGKERGAQFQNMPREYKPLFRARDGRVIIEADYSQLEFMVAVELSGDKQGMADITGKHDVHKFTASVLKRKPVEQVTAAERQAAKPDTFKPLYGGQSGTPRQKAYYQAFRERYPQIDAMQQSWIAETLRTKQLKSASGLVYYFPDTRVTQSGYVVNTASICNYPVQAFATADIVLIGLAHIYWRLQGTGVRLLNTVHDSVVMEAEQGFKIAPIARQALIEDVRGYVKSVYGRELSIPLRGEYLVARHWGDKDEAVESGVF